MDNLPQALSDLPGRNLALIVLALILGISTCSGGDGAPTYVTEEVSQQSLDLTVTATGNLRPTNQVTVGSEVNGPVERVLVANADQLAVVTALAHVIATEGLYDEAFIRERCDWDEFLEMLEVPAFTRKLAKARKRCKKKNKTGVRASEACECACA